MGMGYKLGVLTWELPDNFDLVLKDYSTLGTEAQSSIKGWIRICKRA